MADVAKTLVAIARGDFDDNLGDIADVLAVRQADLMDQQLAAVVLAAYVKSTGTSIEDALAAATEGE